MLNFLRTNKIASYVLTFLRVWLGYEWITAGIGKFQHGFDASGFLKGVIANPVKGPQGDVLYGWWVSFLQNVALPNVHVFNVIVPLGEVLIGLGLILGCLTTIAMFFGLFMNFSFFFSGTVSHNPIDILVGFIILVAGLNAGQIGLDRWVIPAIRKGFKKKPVEQVVLK